MNIAEMNAPASTALATQSKQDKSNSSEKSADVEELKPPSSSGMNAPKSTAFLPKPRKVEEDEEDVPKDFDDENDADEEEAGNVENGSDHDEEEGEEQEDPEKKAKEEEDEEMRIAIEMAVMAAQNPTMSPDQIRKLVAEKNKQVAIVDEIQHKKEAERKRENEERWNERKDSAYKWWHGKTEAIFEQAIELRDAAEERAEEIQDRVNRRIYAEDIKKDPEFQEIRKKIKITEKVLKANKLQGNRVETRHTFKRQRQEKALVKINGKVDKTKKLFISSSYNVHEYAKAMMRASKKWKKKSSDEEIVLEAQLCRNMHQMLAIEKQKTKLKKSTREMKKYLQRCKGWLSDKKALCEMHLMTIDCTNSSMLMLYEDTLEQQDKLIAKLKASGEFDGVDLESIELDNWKELSELSRDRELGPSATLNALRGLPMNDSIRLMKGQLNRLDDSKAPPEQEGAAKKTLDVVVPENGGRPELHIHVSADDDSVNSQLSDPDEDPDEAVQEKADDASDSSLDFGQDAPWAKSASSSNLAGSASSDDDEPVAPSAVVGLEKSDDEDGKPAAVEKTEEVEEAAADEAEVPASEEAAGVAEEKPDDDAEAEAEDPSPDSVEEPAADEEAEKSGPESAEEAVKEAAESDEPEISAESEEEAKQADNGDSEKAEASEESGKAAASSMTADTVPSVTSAEEAAVAEEEAEEQD